MSREKDISDVRILVMDDKPDVLHEARAWLEEEFGYRYVETVRTLEEAKERLRQPFDVIIADMWMDDYNHEGGVDILEEVKQGHITSVVIILTANETAIDCRKAFKMGAWDYIPKNMTKDMPGGIAIFESELLSLFWRKHIDVQINNYTGTTYASPASARNFLITGITFVASSIYVLNTLTTAALSCSKSEKYLRCVASRLVFFQSFSIGFLSGENAGRRCPVRRCACSC